MFKILFQRIVSFVCKLSPLLYILLLNFIANTEVVWLTDLPIYTLVLFCLCWEGVLNPFGSPWPITCTYRCGFRKSSRFVTTGTEMSPDIQLQVCCDVRNPFHMIEDGDHIAGYHVIDVVIVGHTFV